MMQYVIRFSKLPPEPSRTIRKRSYKNFKVENYLADLAKTDWTDVLVCEDLDIATELFTNMLVSILNVHAPWVVYQRRKNFLPWITNETKVLMQERDELKAKAKEITLKDNESGCGVSPQQISAWQNFKKN